MTKESETVAPAADRSHIVVVLVALIMISAVGVLFGRRKR
ncbi:LPXTG cell wall anchor domain-containing protein [Rhodococcus qingshengii]|uniref:LPXTG cell wall anchor domain-containing protein n=1 Tax=Rhodococcus erythropolis TaxID=1833 RepID=A0A6G9D1L6_RHOER|nr:MULTISPECIES: LPXTG cell wall anchor domain-containing protein [Rhodococcus]MBQ9054728.1 LPXTG cell wall anchor domain-containing protein [Rhodococcus sp. (in: high G+C Gram-positive bacteria)]MCE4161987.1 LPXTG cell wall anchor domain-containing protein [Rhodococcus sp. Ni2]MCT6735119.1 LPXTG cell wall anchor domain-containing protein [Rhodococcus qingshengii]MDI9958602.1 LPXTG cell wall anchor domain-containing protein [Rhodococcus sp. IEGM 1237]MDI9964243.1 LPXTG cell wall anchor domain-